MEDCIFCKIVKKEIPAFTIYEDESFFAFLDIFPRVKGHALVIPKEHHRWTYDVPNFGQYWEVAKKVAQSLQKTLAPDFISFLTFGEEVPHAHIHVLPQPVKTRCLAFSPVIDMPRDEIAQLAEKVMANS